MSQDSRCYSGALDRAGDCGTQMGPSCGVPYGVRDKCVETAIAPWQGDLQLFDMISTYLTM